MPRRYHRLAGAVMGLPVLLWMITGLLFHVKHRYGEAYETLSVPTTVEAPFPEARVSPADLTARGMVDAGSPIALGRHPDFGLAWYGSKEGMPVAVDAVGGMPMVVADVSRAREWAERAVSASRHRARYGKPIEVEDGTHRSDLTGVEDPAAAIIFDGGKVVLVDRVTGEVSQRGALNDWIDLTYRIHYLQWTPWPAVNVALVLAAFPVTLGLALTGLWMASRPRAEASTSSHGDRPGSPTPPVE